MNIISNILVSIAVLTASDTSFSQDRLYADKNNFSITTNFYNFLNGGPTIQTKHFGKPLAFINSFGINYARRVNEKNLWSIGVNYHTFFDYTPYSEMERGTYSERRFFDIRGNYSRPIYSKKRNLLCVDFGTGIRLGNEIIFGNYWTSGGVFAETFVLAKSLVDFGLSTGLKYQYFVGKNFHLYSKLAYTFYVFTLDSKDESYSWDRGPTRHMATFSLGIGLNYGGK